MPVFSGSAQELSAPNLYDVPVYYAERARDLGTYSSEVIPPVMELVEEAGTWISPANTPPVLGTEPAALSPSLPSDTVELNLTPEWKQQKKGADTPSLKLLSQKVASRYATGSWAHVMTGYGDVFPNDTVGRGRMNGSGIQDPDSLYVKLIVKF